jgi:hypothetical protein
MTAKKTIHECLPATRPGLSVAAIAELTGYDAMKVRWTLKDLRAEKKAYHIGPRMGHTWMRVAGTVVASHGRPGGVACRRRQERAAEVAPEFSEAAARDLAAAWRVPACVPIAHSDGA